jgi:hypothetical protein
MIFLEIMARAVPEGFLYHADTLRYENGRWKCRLIERGRHA